MGRHVVSVVALLREYLPAECRIETVEGTAAMAERARQAKAQGFERLGVAGGDGTVGIILRCLLDEACRIPVGILPFGTYNNFSTSVGVPSDIPEACKVFLEGVPHAIDLGRVISRNPPATFVFKEMVGAGVDANAFSSSIDMAGPAKIPVGLLSTLGAILSFRPHPVRFRCEGDPRWTRSTQIVVANTPRYGPAFPVVPEALPDDGALDILARTWRGRSDLMRELPAILGGRHGELEHGQYRRTTRVEIAGSHRVLMHADGEFFCRLPAVVEILPSALEVLVPVVASTPETATPARATELGEHA